MKARSGLLALAALLCLSACATLFSGCAAKEVSQVQKQVKTQKKDK